VDARLRRHDARPAAGVLHLEVHHRLRPARRLERPEHLWRRLRLPACPARRADDDGADDDLAFGILGEEQESRARRDGEDRLAVPRVQDVLRTRTAEPTQPRQRPEERDLVRPHRPDGLQDPLPRRLDADAVDLVELVVGREAVERRPRCLDVIPGRRRDEGHDRDEEPGGHEDGPVRPPAKAQQSERLHEAHDPGERHDQAEVEEAGADHAARTDLPDLDL